MPSLFENGAAVQCERVINKQTELLYTVSKKV